MPAHCHAGADCAAVVPAATMDDHLPSMEGRAGASPGGSVARGPHIAQMLAVLDEFAHVAQHVMQAKGVRRVHADHCGQASVVITCNRVSCLACQAGNGHLAATVE